MSIFSVPSWAMEPLSMSQEQADAINVRELDAFIRDYGADALNDGMKRYIEDHGLAPKIPALNGGPPLSDQPGVGTYPIYYASQQKPPAPPAPPPATINRPTLILSICAAALITWTAFEALGAYNNMCQAEWDKQSSWRKKAALLARKTAQRFISRFR